MKYSGSEERNVKADDRDSVHNQINSIGKFQKFGEVTIAAELGLIRNHTKVSHKTKLKSTHIRRALNAAKRIKDIDDQNDKKLHLTNKAKSVPNLSLKSTVRKEVISELDIPDTNDLIPNTLSKRFVEKALQSVDAQMAIEKSQIDVLEEESYCQASKLKQIDKYIRNYRRSNVHNSSKRLTLENIAEE